MKLKQIMPAPPGWIVVHMTIVSDGKGDIVVPSAEPCLAFGLATDAEETDGVLVPLRQQDFGDDTLYAERTYGRPGRRLWLLPSSTPMELLLGDAEDEARETTELRRKTNPDAPALRAMIWDRVAQEQIDDGRVREIMEKLRSQKRYYRMK